MRLPLPHQNIEYRSSIACARAILHCGLELAAKLGNLLLTLGDGSPIRR